MQRDLMTFDRFFVLAAMVHGARMKVLVDTSVHFRPSFFSYVIFLKSGLGKEDNARSLADVRIGFFMAP